jgi:tetratricopeptide (TPR) repeat protein
MRARACRLVVLVAALAAFRPAVRAESIILDVYNVPVDRLVANLEALVAKEPRNVEWLINLGRVHVMAFASKRNDIAVARGSETQGPVKKWLRENELPDVTVTADPARLKEASAQLAKAIKRFQEAIALAPDNTVARLGLAWAYQQSQQRDKAVGAYRQAVAVAYPQESKRATLWGWRSVTEEASRYLIPLLDPETDKEEIAKLKEKTADVEKMGRAITPIAIPLADGLSVADLIDLEARVPFDLDGSGLARSWTWITPNAAWLVCDPHHQGRIHSGLQLFGNVTFWLFWANGYEALGSLDDDHDGRLRGPELAGLALWHDVNGNGVSEEGEVRPLADWGIVELSCENSGSRSKAEARLLTAFSPAGVRFGDGSTRPTYDVTLRRRQ